MNIWKLLAPAYFVGWRMALRITQGSMDERPKTLLQEIARCAKFPRLSIGVSPWPSEYVRHFVPFFVFAALALPFSAWAYPVLHIEVLKQCPPETHSKTTMSQGRGGIRLFQKKCVNFVGETMREIFTSQSDGSLVWLNESARIQGPGYAAYKEFYLHSDDLITVIGRHSPRYTYPSY